MKVIFLASIHGYGSSGVGVFAFLLCQQLRRRDANIILAPIHPDLFRRAKVLARLMRQMRPDWVSLPMVWKERLMVNSAIRFLRPLQSFGMCR